MSRRLLLALALAPALPALPAYALRCPDGIVDPGAHKVEVLDACGEPESRERVATFPRRPILGGLPGEYEYLGLPVVAEEWVYEFGPQRFRRLLRFRDGRLTHVETLEKPR
jgi:hypothetical protein